MQPENPRWGLILGIARTLRLELSLPFSTVGLNTWDSNILISLIKIYKIILLDMILKIGLPKCQKT
jgi:hypothetical protein